MDKFQLKGEGGDITFVPIREGSAQGHFVSIISIYSLSPLHKGLQTETLEARIYRKHGEQSQLVTTLFSDSREDLEAQIRDYASNRLYKIQEA